MKDNRTEKATPKRKDEARKRGQVARSPEVGVALSLLAGFGVLAAAGGWVLLQLAAMLASSLSAAGTTHDLTAPDAVRRMIDAVTETGRMIAPFMVAALVVGIAGSVIQVKPGLTLQTIKPRFSVVNPIKGLPRLFSLRSAVQLVRDLIKVTIIGTVAFVTLRSGVGDIMGLTGAGPGQIMSVVGALVLKLGFAVAACYVAIALADALYQRWQFERDLRMTKDEVKREAREADVAPEVKGQLKRRQREMATRRMMAEVPNADVLITNPTHFAVALRYARSLPAPQVIAKGQDRVALRMIEIARENGVAVHQDPPLARSLYAAADVGGFVPPEAFAAVAEILAYVYRAAGREPAAA